MAHYIVSQNVLNTPAWQLVATFEATEAQATIVSDAYKHAFPDRNWRVESTESNAPNPGVPVLDVTPIGSPAITVTKQLSQLLVGAFAADMIFGPVGEQVTIRKVAATQFSVTASVAMFLKWQQNEAAQLKEVVNGASQTGTIAPEGAPAAAGRRKK
jgi:hypothetical protein